MNAPTLPTRDFILVLDPHSAEDLLHRPMSGAVTLSAALEQLDPPINVRLVLPGYLATRSQLEIADRLRVGRGGAPLGIFADETAVPTLTLSRDLRRPIRERIQRGAEGDCRALRLLSLAHFLKADGIVTTIPSLLQPRYGLLHHHKCRLVPPTELADFVEICARGHGVSCSATLAPTWPPPDVLYQYAHWKARRLFAWFGNVSPGISDKTLNEHLRSALLNRYPFILQARDLVRFFELQKDHHFRRGRQPQVFRAPLNYHLTAFYVHVWGMLDALTGIANRRLGLGVNPRLCGITSDELLEALGKKRPGLLRFIKRLRARWISVIGDIRHPVAHSALRLQQDFVQATEESKKPDDEILAILRQEDPEIYEILPAHVVKALEPMLIQNWRLARMKVVSDDAIYVEQPDGSGYFRQPVTSIDFDLEMLNAFVDAFLVGCFARSAGP
jgi:hypothetical protein